jgi:hypothetical protein
MVVRVGELSKSPYAVVVPYTTRESDNSSVVQEMVAVANDVEEAIEEINGGVTSGAISVVKILSDEVAPLRSAS